MRLIDADALKEKAFSDPDTTMPAEALVYVQDIDEQPTINPADLVPKGRWYWAEDRHCKCSVCGHYAVVKRIVVKTNFCPACGADMRG